MKILLRLLVIFGAAASHAATTINTVNHDAYGANVGWINARGDGTNGAVIGQLYCTGYVWSANCGWIALGNGPTNGWHYSNAAANDWGVNHDGAGNLSGQAWGANIGWITFETNGAPRINIFTGKFDGYAYGANVGWINLSNNFAHVQTDILAPGPDTDTDGIPDSWENQYADGTVILGPVPTDSDGDGVPDVAEYMAGTDPLDNTDYLHIIALDRSGDTNSVSWPVVPTRIYRIEQATAVTNNASWTDTGLGLASFPAPSTATAKIPDPASTTRFYRANAILPLAP